MAQIRSIKEKSSRQFLKASLNGLPNLLAIVWISISCHFGLDQLWMKAFTALLSTWASGNTLGHFAKRQGSRDEYI